jgi:hypothetical protein
MATTLATKLVLDALNMALLTRRPRDVIHHSDQGSQYTSIEFGKRCRDAGVRPSMGSVGDAYDNAMCESFFATLECELLARCRFKTPAEARRTVFAFIAPPSAVACGDPGPSLRAAAALPCGSGRKKAPPGDEPKNGPIQEDNMPAHQTA